MSVKIVGIDGAARVESKTRKLLEMVGHAVQQNEAEFVLFSQLEHKLPIFDGDPVTAKSTAVQALFEIARGADGFILSSPEYHGSMSGALKNALDWLTFESDEGVSGRVFGLVGGGGALANSGATIQMMMSVRAMHGWLMPDVVVSVSNIWDMIQTGNDQTPEDLLRGRIDSFASKLVAYSEQFRLMRDRLAA